MAKRKLTRGDACAILYTSGAGYTSDFHTLPSSVVDRLVTAAKKVGYRKSKSAPGSRGRMFHQYLTRLCR